MTPLMGESVRQREWTIGVCPECGEVVGRWRENLFCRLHDTPNGFAPTIRGTYGRPKAVPVKVQEAA